MLDPTIDQIIASCPFEPQAVRVRRTEWSETAITALRVWPNPRWAVYVPGRRRWQAGAVGAAGVVLSDPRKEHSDSRELQGWDVDAQALLEQVPAAVRDAIACQPRVFAWRVLQMIDAVPAAITLARELPVLAGMLAWPSRDADPDPFEEVRALIHQPRRRLLPLLGLPPERWIIRVIGKMDPRVLRELGDDRLVEVLGATDKEVQRRLQHLPSLPTDVVEVIVDAKLRRMTTFGLLADPAEGHRDLAEKLIRLDRAGRTRRYSSRAEVHAAHQALPADLQRLETEQWNPAEYAGEFQTPTGIVTVPGRPALTLVPVRTSEQMRAHGLDMRSCIPADDRYPLRAARGAGVMYELRWGRRGAKATLWLRREDGGGWVVAELAGPENGRVTPGITARLEAWAASLASAEPGR